LTISVDTDGTAASISITIMALKDAIVLDFDTARETLIAYKKSISQRAILSHQSLIEEYNLFDIPKHFQV
jgi:hypothetical protein